MAYKTKAEIFGDGGGFGAAAPVSTSNPPGFAATNRAIVDTENVSGAIINRTTAVLAENCDILQAAIAAVAGLDGAYNGGSVVTLDAGAIETVSALSSPVGDLSHFRANARGDGAGVSIGFEAVSDRSGVSGLSGNDMVAGLMDRRGLAFMDDSVFGINESATLNPGGALSTTVQLSGGGLRFKNGSATNIIIGLDTVEITDSATDDGLYLITGITSDTRVTVQSLDGSAAVFSVADEAVVITVFRPRFATWGGYSSRTNLRGTVIAGDQGTTLDLVPGSPTYSSPSGGSANAVRVFHHDGLGALTNTFILDTFGRMITNVHQGRFTSADSAAAGASAGVIINKSLAPADSGEIGVLVTSSLATSRRHDFLSLVPVVAPAGLGFSTSIACTFGPDGTAELSGMTAPWRSFVVGSCFVVEILTPSTHAGYYTLFDTQNSPNRVRCLQLSGDVLTGLWPAGAGSIRIHRVTDIGDYEGISVSPRTVSVGVGSADDAVGIEIGMPNAFYDAAGVLDLGTPLREALRVLSPDSVSPGTYNTRASIRGDGAIRSAATFEYIGTRSYVKILPITKGLSWDPTATTNSWQFNPVTLKWTGLQASSSVYFPIELPDGAILTEYEVLVTAGAAGRTPAGNRLQCVIYQKELATAFLDIVEPVIDDFGYDDDDGNDGVQILGSGALSLDINNDLYDYLIRVTTGSTFETGDFIHGIRLTYTDPGPRNH